jgi:hypothetical protein
MVDSCLLLARLQADLLTVTARSAGMAWVVLASAMVWSPGAPAPPDADLRMLGLQRMPSSRDELRWAYRTAAKAAHPDVGGSEDAFRAVSKAFQRFAAGAPRPT